MIRGVINYNDEKIFVDEHSVNQIVFSHKDGKSQILLTTFIDGEAITFPGDMIESLKIAHIDEARPEDAIEIAKVID
jgi:hypothetical protein